MGSILADLKVKPSIAKYIPADVASEKDAVEAWLKANGEDFGIDLSTQGNDQGQGEQSDTSGQQSTIPPALQEQWNRIAAQSTSQGSMIPDLEQQQLAALASMNQQAGSVDDLVAMLNAGGIPSP